MTTSSIFNSVDIDIDRMINNVFAGEFNQALYPPVFTSTDENNYRLEAELPGYTENEIELKMEKNKLIISHEATSKDKRKKSFTRVFQIPEEANKEKVSATMKDGLLVISFPKKEEAKPTTIAISKT